MEKYGTYLVYENNETKEIKRVIISEKDDIEKIASLSNWHKLEADPIDKETINDK